jgi:TPR repeat protein
MNKLQKIILSLYAAVIIVMCLIPPYQRHEGAGMRDTGYRFIWETTPYTTGTVNVQLLGIQMLVASLVAAALWLVAKDGNPLAGWSVTEGVSSRKTKRTALAFIVCFTLFFVYHIGGSILFHWKYGGGAIPMAIATSIIIAVWRAIRGTGSDSATEQNGSSSAQDVQSTSAQTSAAPQQTGYKQQPSSTSLKSPTPLFGIAEPAELSGFELLAKEKEAGFRHEALWLKCFSESEGDQARADAAYNRERASTLVAQAAAEKDAALAHSAARLGAWRAAISQHMTKIEGLLAEVPKQKARAASFIRINGRDWLVSIPKMLSKAIMDFQSAAEILQKEIQPADWSGCQLKPILASAIRQPEGGGNSHPTWFDCLGLVKQGDAWEHLLLRIKEANEDFADWLAMHAEHTQVLTVADSAISTKESAKVITALYDKLRGVRFADLNYKKLEGFILARESRPATLLLATFCLTIAGIIGYGIYRVETSAQPQGLKTEAIEKPPTGSAFSANQHTPNAIAPATLAALAANAPIAEIRSRAEEGETDAQFRLGDAYNTGEGVSKDDVEAVRWYRKAAEQGHAKSQNELGFCYRDGVGVSKDLSEAFQWFRKAAEQGLAEAQNELGFCYHEGEGVPQDDVEAVKWFRKAAEQGHAMAQNTLGAHYQRGEGVPQDDVEAVKWYRKAAEQGDATAQDNLGHCYHRGEGVLQDEVEGVRWFRKAAEQGHAEAQNTLAICYDHGLGISQDYGEAVKWYHKAAVQGHALAQNYLGMCYRDGVLVAKDDLEAVKWFRKAAEQEFAYAQFNLGFCYSKGEGVPQYYVEAVKWHRKAAEQGLAIAQFFMGVHYETGHGVPKDALVAAQWYRKAAEQGYALAQSSYGWCYHKGVGVRQDDVEAVSWFRKAAEQGHAEAQYRLGICYDYSVGVPKDIIEATKWFILAAAQQDELSVKSLTNIEKEMTREQIAEAHRRANEFKRQHADVPNPR